VRVEGERAKDRVRAEGERAKAEEQRRRRRVQWALAAAVVGLLALAGLGAAVANLWQRAEGERQRAEKARDGEKAARAEVEREREKFERFEYARTMEVAHSQWRDNNLVAMRALLDGTNPRLRGWEWGYLDRLCDSSLLTLQGHTSAVSSASFSGDGTRVVTGSRDTTARVWDGRTGAEVLTLKGHTGPVNSASFSADGTRVVTGSRDTTAKVWDARPFRDSRPPDPAPAPPPTK